MPPEKNPYDPPDVSPEMKECMRLINKECSNLSRMIKDLLPAESRYRSLALTRLEDVAMWTNKGIAMK